MRRRIINPAWASAPYHVVFLLGIGVPKAWKKCSRKRRRHWLRQIRRAHRFDLGGPPNLFSDGKFIPTDWVGESHWR